jgi:hypothetical protein
MDASSELDLEGRELCPDGSCIGVLGEDGRCRECGRTREEAAAGVEVRPTAEAAAGGVGSSSAGAVEGGGFDDAGRELCPDGSCIGLMGADGRCKECGRTRGS